MYLKVLTLSLKRGTVRDIVNDYFAIFQSTFRHHKNDGRRLDEIEDDKREGCNDGTSADC